MSTTTVAPARGTTTTKQKVGLVVAFVYALTNLPSALIPPTEEGQDGPPYAILVICSVLSLVAMVAAVMAWRGNRPALRVCAGALIVITLTSLPAFFVDVPMWVKVLVAVSVVWTVVAVVLMLSGERRPAAVVD